MNRDMEIQPRQIKILHLIDSGGLYGAEKVVLTLCNKQIRKGYKSTILSCGLPHDPPKAIEVEAGRCGIPFIAWRMAAGLNLKGMHDIWSYINSEGFTHLHSHGYKFNILLALTKTFRNGQFFIATLHGYTSTKLVGKGAAQQFIDRLMLVRFDAICWVGAKTALSAWVKMVNHRRIKYIKNGVPLKCNTRKRDLSKVKKLLIVGRLSSEKGVYYAIETLTELRSAGVDMSLTIAGDGPLRYELYNMAKKLGVSESVEFLGFEKNVYPLYETHDLLLIPSLTEGLPLVMLEAASVGMPIIASSVGAIPEVLRAEEFLVPRPIGSSSLLERISNWIALDELTRINLVESLMDRVVNCYSCEAMAENYRCVYEDLNGKL